MAKKKYASLVILSILLSTSYIDNKKALNFPTINVNDNNDIGNNNHDLDNKNNDNKKDDSKKNSENEIKRANASDYVYQLNETSSEVTIYDLKNKSVTCINIPSSILIGSKEYPVTKIGDKAFSSYDNLEYVTIPKSVESIGKQAFYNCKNLNTFYVSLLNPHFASLNGIIYNYDYTKLVLCPTGYSGEVLIPTSLNYIGSYAFSNCTKITEVTLPNNVKSIREGAFYGCTSLSKVNLSPKLTSIGTGTFSNTKIETIAIPSSVTTIGPWAFRDCKSLTEFVFPDSVTSISYMMFANCSNLNYVYIPRTTITIEHNAFLNCTSLNRVHIPSSVLTIETNAFKGMSQSAVIEIEYKEKPDGFASDCNPDNINEDLDCLNSNTFVSGNFIYKILSDDENDRKVEVVGLDPLHKVIDGKPLTTLDLNDDTVSVVDNSNPNQPVSKTYNVVSIKDDAFRDNKTITQVNLGGKNLQNIGRHTFDGCSNLTGFYYVQKQTGVDSQFDSIPEYCFANTKVFDLYSTSKDDFKCVKKIKPYSFASLANTVSDKDGIRLFKKFTNLKTINSYTFDSLYQENPYNNLVHVNESLEEIDSYAFNEAKTDNILLNRSIKKINHFAFANISGTTRSYNFLSIAFADRQTIGENYIIENDTIYDNAKENLYYVNNYATNLVIPSTLKNIDFYAFESMNDVYGIATFSVEDGNDVFFIENNILYQKGSIIGSDNQKVETVTLLRASKSLSGKVKISDKTTHINNYAFANCSNIVQIDFNDNLRYVGDYAFIGCSNLNYAMFKNGVKSIGRGAFKNCTSLQRPDLPDSMSSISSNLFEGCTALKKVNLPTELKEIGDNAFLGCTTLTYLHLPNALVDIGSSAFTDCTRLNEITFDDNNQTFFYENGAIYKARLDSSNKKVPDELIQVFNTKNYTIPETVTKIAESGYESFKNLTSLSCSANNEYFSYTSTGNALFSKDSNGHEEELLYVPAYVTDITLNDYVSYISSRAFKNEDKLVNINVSANNDKYYSIKGQLLTKDKTKLIKVPINNGNTITCDELTTILPGAYKGNKVMTMMNFTSIKNVNSIAYGEFKDIPTLTTAYNLNQYALDNFHNIFDDTKITFIQLQYATNIPDGMFSGMTSLQKLLTLENRDSVENRDLELKIGEKAFYNCTNLKEVYLTTKVTSIGDSAFENCSNLSIIDFKYYNSEDSKIKSIGSSAFKNCSKISTLKNINYATNLESIGEEAFKGCTALTSLPISNSKLKVLENSLLENCTSLKSFSTPKTLTTIKSKVFNNTLLSSFTFNDTMKIDDIDFNSFDNTNVSNFDVNYKDGYSSSNYPSRLGSENGILYYDNGKLLVRCPYKKTGDITLPTAKKVGANLVTTNEIRKDAFKNCTLITSFIDATMASETQLVTIPDGTFKDCSKLTKVRIGNDTLVRRFTSVFDGSIVSDVVFSGYVTTISDSAFSGCTGLQYVSFDNYVPDSNVDYSSLTYIGDNAFYGCINLKDFGISNVNLVSSKNSSSYKRFHKLITIGKQAFMNCSELGNNNKNRNYFVIPVGVETIGDRAFKGCVYLKNNALIHKRTSHISNKGYNSWNPDQITIQS